MYYVYILLCDNGSLYTGVTTDVVRRFKLHQAKKGAKYTRSFRPIKIIYKQGFRTQSRALKREREIKSWARDKKLRLIGRTAKNANI